MSESWENGGDWYFSKQNCFSKLLVPLKSCCLDIGKSFTFQTCGWQIVSKKILRNLEAILQILKILPTPEPSVQTKSQEQFSSTNSFRRIFSSYWHNLFVEYKWIACPCQCNFCDILRLNLYFVAIRRFSQSFFFFRRLKQAAGGKDSI